MKNLSKNGEDKTMSIEESTHIKINGLPILFNVISGKLVEVSLDAHFDSVNSFIERWSIKENTENRFSISKKTLNIITPDKLVHPCEFVCETMIEGDTGINTSICSIIGIKALKSDYLDEFDADIGRQEIEELITDAIMSDSDHETWEEFGFSFALNKTEGKSWPHLRIV